MSGAPYLHTPDGSLIVGQHDESPLAKAFTAAGANGIIFNRGGQAVGAYVDNEVPHQGDVVRRCVALKLGPVIAGISPARPHLHFAGAINALEWYPFGDTSSDAMSFQKPPLKEAYILQWDFAWPNCPPPNAAERLELLAAARARRPKLILLY